MRFLITFLEGVITFLSPCILPMLPVYILYFAGDAETKNSRRTLTHAVGFVMGFTILFTLLGIFAGSLGSLLAEHLTAVHLVTGAAVVFFGLHYTGLLRIGLLDRTIRPNTQVAPDRFLSSVLFGAVFAVGWSPCVGTFLGSAMMLAAGQGGWLTGMLLLLTYSLGLGIPFLLCAVLIDRLKSTLDWINRHYRIFNLVCGVFLILVGVLMMTGLFFRIAALFG